MKILVPIDGSELSLAALRHAIALVREGLRAELVLANVQSPASLYEWMRAPDAEALGHIAEAAGQHALQTAESLLREAGLDATEVLVSGDPAHALIELIESEGCDAVVMGSHGGGLLAAFQGSVSQAMLSASPVPVTLVKPVDVGAARQSDDEDMQEDVQEGAEDEEGQAAGA
jgi:nucleotide-binding universal stress UspA family protein